MPKQELCQFYVITFLELYGSLFTTANVIKPSYSIVFLGYDKLLASFFIGRGSRGRYTTVWGRCHEVTEGDGRLANPLASYVSEHSIFQNCNAEIPCLRTLFRPLWGELFLCFSACIFLDYQEVERYNFVQL